MFVLTIIKLTFNVHNGALQLPKSQVSIVSGTTLVVSSWTHQMPTGRYRNNMAAGYHGKRHPVGRWHRLPIATLLVGSAD